MIITRLTGGLGNQLFQYAAGRRLALRHGVPLKLDLGDYVGNPLRSYRLGHWAVAAEPATAAEIAALRGGDGLLGMLARWRESRRPAPLQRRYQEAGLAFDARVLQLGPEVYLQGYWQNEGYFADSAPLLRQELQVITAPSPAAAALAEAIAGCAAVSVHVRRGDYLHAGNERVHGVLGLDYYRRAMDLVAGRVAGAQFFLFSDDPAWAGAAIGFGHPARLASGTGTPDYEDMRLMRGCRHHIIANSSFSWWAAWLGEQADSMVVAPERWFAAAERDGRGIAPGRWARV